MSIPKNDAPVHPFSGIAICYLIHDFNPVEETLNKKVSVGDFAKACIKLSNISKEFYAMSEYLGFVELSHKLSKIDGYVLKYIATTQSLYV